MWANTIVTLMLDKLWRSMVEKNTIRVDVKRVVPGGHSELGNIAAPTSREIQ